MPETSSTAVTMVAPIPPSDGLFGFLALLVVALALGQLNDRFFAHRSLSIARWTAWIGAVILFARFIGQIWNQPPSATTYAVGLGALILLVAGWRMLGEIFAGGLLLLGRRHHLGERLQLGAHRGVLERMGLTSVTLRQADGRAVLIPNSALFRETVAYPTAPGGETPATVQFPVPAGVAPEQARIWAERAALASGFASPYRRPEVSLTRQGDGWRLEVQVFSFEPSLAGALTTDVLLRFERQRQSAHDGPATNG